MDGGCYRSAGVIWKTPGRWSSTPRHCGAPHRRDRSPPLRSHHSTASVSGSDGVTDHQLFLFLAEVTVLLVAARIGSEIAARLGIPLHVGELVMGLLIGPSFLGWLWPGAFHALFPKDPSQRNLLEIISWTGIIFLVLLGGL